MRVVALCLLAFVCACASAPKTPSEERSFTAYVDLALSYMSQNNLPAARNSLAQAQQIDDSDARLLHAYGMLYQLTGDLQDAETAFKEALRADPDFSQAYNNYGVFLSRLKRYPESLVQLRQAAADPNYVHRSIAYENLAEVAVQSNNLQLAVESIQNAIAQSPNEKRYYLRAAHLLYLYKDYKKGLDYFNRYLEMVDNQGIEATVPDLRIGYALAIAQGDDATRDYVKIRLELLGASPDAN